MPNKSSNTFQAASLRVNFKQHQQNSAPAFSPHLTKKYPFLVSIMVHGHGYSVVSVRSLGSARYSGEGPRALIDLHMTRETWKGGIHQHSDNNGSAISYQNDLDTDKKNTIARITKAHKAA